MVVKKQQAEDESIEAKARREPKPSKAADELRETREEDEDERDEDPEDEDEEETDDDEEEAETRGEGPLSFETLSEEGRKRGPEPGAREGGAARTEWRTAWAAADPMSVRI